MVLPFSCPNGGNLTGIAWPTATPADIKEGAGHAGCAQIYDVEDGPDGHGSKLLVWTIIEPDGVDPDVERGRTLVFTQFGGAPLFEGGVLSHERALAACGYELARVEAAA